MYLLYFNVLLCAIKCALLDQALGYVFNAVGALRSYLDILHQHFLLLGFVCCCPQL